VAAGSVGRHRAICRQPRSQGGYLRCSLTEPSAFERDFADDDALADAVDGAGIPVVFAANVSGGRASGIRHSHQTAKNLGAVNQQADSVLRWFHPQVEGYPSLAARAVETGRRTTARRPFLLHYYGPHVDPTGRKTFPYISASTVIDAFLKNPAATAPVGDPTFKGKIVLVGAITAGTYDLKVTPLSPIYPGTEYEATAIVNMLQHQRVEPAATLIIALMIFATAILSALFAGLPRAAYLKLILGIAPIAAIIAISAAYFHRLNIFWLPPSAAIASGLLALTAALCWSYFLEDRQQKFFLKALAQYVSPAVAMELSRDRTRLRLSSERREMTVLFTDIAGFTDLSESLAPDRLGDLLNFYLGKMSDVVLNMDGTLDKYIGDAIMAFWNAPLDQRTTRHVPARWRWPCAISRSRSPRTLPLAAVPGCTRASAFTPAPWPSAIWDRWTNSITVSSAMRLTLAAALKAPISSMARASS